MAVLRRIGTMHAVTIQLPRSDIGHIAMPGEIGALWELELFSIRMLGGEQAEFHRRGVLAEQGEIHPGSVPGGTEWIGAPGPHSGAHAIALLGCRAP